MTEQIHNKTPRLVFIGPPGAGKSTISEHLEQYIPLTTIATGDRLRAEVAKESDLGREVKEVLDQGHLVSDNLMNRLMHDWLAHTPAERGVVLDGYPRSPEQARALSEMLHEIDRQLDLVIAFDVSEDEVVRRLSGRRICEGGGASFTLHISDEAAVQRCHARGGHLVQRDDDAPDVVAERLRTYHQETQPLLEFYDQQGLLRHIDGNSTPEEITNQVLEVLRTEL